MGGFVAAHRCVSLCESVTMIIIDKSQFVGKGHHREVYRHPKQSALCVKINVDEHYDTREIERENAYFEHLEKRGIHWESLSRYYGDIQTDLGVGSVFDLILDDDDSVSKTLGYYLADDSRTGKYYRHLLNALAKLRDGLLRDRIITKSLAHRNIVCQKTSTGISRMVVIDNIGNAEFIPISSYISFFGKRKVQRKWLRFEDKLVAEFAENGSLKRMLSELKQTA